MCVYSTQTLIKKGGKKNLKPDKRSGGQSWLKSVQVHTETVMQARRDTVASLTFPHMLVSFGPLLMSGI